MSSKKLEPSVLVVEDDDSITSVIRYNLEKEGYNVVSVNDGAEGLAMVKRLKPDLVLLDRVLPSLPGIDICKAIRSTPDLAGTPVIIISAHGSEIDKIFGLDRGADDYISKPFSAPELLARIRAVLRRIRPAFSSTIFSFEDLLLDVDARTVYRGDTELKLSPIEFKILHIMIESPGRVFNREFLMDKIWGGNVFVGNRTIDVHITRLRKILESAGDGSKLIATVRLGGYTLKAARSQRKPEQE